jgi:spore coat protein U-like protein
MKIKYLFFILFFTSGVVLADCGLEINAPVLTYGVGDANPVLPAQVTIKRTKSGDDRCSNYYLAFTYGWSNNYNRRGLNLSNGNLIYYNLYKNANATNVLRGPNDITSNNDILFGTIAKDETKTLNYYFQLAPIDASEPPYAGTYYDNVQVQGYTGTYTNINAYEGMGNLQIYINVPKFTSLSLVDTGGAYDGSQTSKTQDFGELSENEELIFDVRIVSNAGYILKVSSANNGILNRIDGTGIKSQISYDFYSSGTKRTLTSSASSPVTIATATGRTASGGAQVPIRVVINSVQDKDPGTYQDYVTLSVISND